MGLNKRQRPDFLRDNSRIELTSATSAQTLGFGNYSLESTSTAADTGIVYTLTAPQVIGDTQVLVAHTVGATSAGIQLIASTGATFDGTLDVIDMYSPGSGVTIVAQSTTKWGISGGHLITLAAATS